MRRADRAGASRFAPRPPGAPPMAREFRRQPAGYGRNPGAARPHPRIARRLRAARLLPPDLRHPRLRPRPRRRPPRCGAGRHLPVWPNEPERGGAAARLAERTRGNRRGGFGQTNPGPPAWSKAGRTNPGGHAWPRPAPASGISWNAPDAHRCPRDAGWLRAATARQSACATRPLVSRSPLRTIIDRSAADDTSSHPAADETGGAVHRSDARAHRSVRPRAKHAGPPSCAARAVDADGRARRDRGMQPTPRASSRACPGTPEPPRP